MHVVKDDEGGAKKRIEMFIDKSVESRALAVAGRWFSVLTPPLLTGALVWIATTVIGTDREMGIVKAKVENVEHRMLVTEGNVDALKDFIAQSRVARERDLGELKQRISVVETQNQSLLESSNRQEEKLDKIFDRLSGTVVR